MDRALSVIIPARNESSIIRRTLTALPLGAPGIEVLVVGGGEDDTTGAALSDFSTVRYLKSPKAQRAAQCNLGAREATHQRLLFLHADTMVTDDGLSALHQQLDNDTIIGGTFRLRLCDAPGRFRITAWGANFRSAVMRLPYGDQGIFCRRSDFDRLGGFPEIALMDDVAFIRQLQRNGRFIMVPHYATTSARRIVRHGVVKNVIRNYGIVLAYLFGVAPERLGKWYRGGKFQIPNSK